MKRFIVTANTKDEAIEKVKKHLAKAKDSEKVSYIVKNDDDRMEDFSIYESDYNIKCKLIDHYHEDDDEIWEWRVTGKEEDILNFIQDYNLDEVSWKNDSLIADKAIKKVKKHLAKDEPSRAEEIDELKKKFENKDKILEEKFDALEKECQSLLDEIVDKMTDYYEKYHADLDALKELNESFEMNKDGFDFKFYPQYGEMIVDIHDIQGIIPDEMIDNIDAELFEEGEDPKADIAQSIKRLKELKERLSALDSDELMEEAFNGMSEYVVKLLDARNKSVGLDAKAKDDKPAEKRIVIEMSDEHIIVDVEKDNPKVDFFLKHIIDGYETWLLSSFEETALEKAIEDIKKALK